MELPQYVTVEEVKRVCKELGMRDWSALAAPEVLPEEVEVLRAEIGGEAQMIAPEEFRKGLEVELEHGTRYPDANVTNNHPILTGKIVLSHLKESLDYYSRLEVAELEGDLLKATLAGKAEKIKSVSQKLAAARAHLAQMEAEMLNR